MNHEYTDPSEISTKVESGLQVPVYNLYLNDYETNGHPNIRRGNVLTRTFTEVDVNDNFMYAVDYKPSVSYSALTTYPPVYKTSENSSDNTIVVPRVYPPIFVRGRRR